MHFVRELSSESEIKPANPNPRFKTLGLGFRVLGLGFRVDLSKYPETLRQQKNKASYPTHL